MSGAKLDTRSRLGRAVFQLVDASVRCTPSVRTIVIRVHNAVAADPEDKSLRFTLRSDLDALAREPRLSSVIRQLWKALPQA